MPRKPDSSSSTTKRKSKQTRSTREQARTYTDKPSGTRQVYAIHKDRARQVLAALAQCAPNQTLMLEPQHSTINPPGSLFFIPFEHSMVDYDWEGPAAEGTLPDVPFDIHTFQDITNPEDAPGAEKTLTMLTGMPTWSVSAVRKGIDRNGIWHKDRLLQAYLAAVPDDFPTSETSIVSPLRASEHRTNEYSKGLAAWGKWINTVLSTGDRCLLLRGLDISVPVTEESKKESEEYRKKIQKYRKEIQIRGFPFTATDTGETSSAGEKGKGRAQEDTVEAARYDASMLSDADALGETDDEDMTYH